MKPSFATNASMAVEPPVQTYNRYYPTPASSSSLREHSPYHTSSTSHPHPRQHSSSSSSSSSTSTAAYSHHPHHRRSYSEYPDQPASSSTPSSSYHGQQQQQHYLSHHSQEKLPQSHSHGPYSPQSSSNPDLAYQQYAQSYRTSAQHVKHTEGYEGRVRNTNRDDNDHLMTDPSAKDQQHYHDQFRRDPTYGYLKQHSSDTPYSPADENVPAFKYQLPPILVPEEPFYRSDLPGRHMRYFSNVTSEDRENSHGYFSSARHVAPSNTTGNFGHGPTINATLERFGNARQRQLEQQRQMQQQEREHSEHDHEDEHHRQQQQDRPRLPSLYAALPEQRPGHGPNVNSQRRDQYPQQEQQQQRARSPVRTHQDNNGHYSPEYQQQLQRQQPNSAGKQRHLQPRSIAPAPISIPGPMSPPYSKSTASPRSPGFFQKTTNVYPSAQQSIVKVEPQGSPQIPQYERQHQQHYVPQQPARYRQQPQEAMDGKRKWSREHSPVRVGPNVNTGADLVEEHQDDAASQELHLLSQRPARATRSALKNKTSSPHPRMRMQRYQLMKIRCWHGAIAQKSYGIEKRYLCPPPMVQVSAGVNAKQIKAEQPHVTMSILHEKLNSGHHSQQGSENLMEQDCTLDDALKCSFRNLHVTGTGADSSKRFKLGVQVYLNKNSIQPTATMDSNPIPIISKPSKKTAKAGNASCFILNGMSVSLLNRINAQTVRTKYMAVDNNAVCAKIGSWSSFTIKMVKPPPAPPVKIVPTGNMGMFKSAQHSTKFVPIRMKGDTNQSAVAPMGSSMTRTGSSSTQGSSNMPQYQSQHGSYHQQGYPHKQQHAHGHRGPQQQQQQQQQQAQQEPTYVFSNSEPVLYGAEIILINDMTGITTDRLVIRKVENGKVIMNGSGPVSQMQKIVLQHPDRVHPEDGRPYYLSASSIGSPKIEGKIPLQAAMDRSPLLEYRTSSKKASIMDMTETPEEEEDEYYGEEGGYGQMPRRVKGQGNVAVDDFVCWTIAGIAKFEYTYFNAIPASIDSDVDPRKVPTVLSSPKYNAQSNTLVMKVKNVFEKLSPAEEEKRLQSAYLDDPYERKLSLAEFVYKRCEDIKQPMQDEEGPIQLWLAQTGPIRMRRRLVKDVLPELAAEDDQQAGQEEEDDDDDDSESEAEEEEQPKQAEDNLPKIPTKANAVHTRKQSMQQQSLGQQKYYGGSHLPRGTTAHGGQTQNKSRVKLLRRAMGLEAELPYGCEVHASHDSEGNAHAEMDILMVERASGVAYRTGYKVVYSRPQANSEWTVEVVG